MRRLQARALLVCALVSSCNGTSMSGSSSKAPASVPPTEAAAAQENKAQIPPLDSGNVNADTSSDGVINPTSTPAPASIPPITQTLVPDSVVDGEEVVNDCGRCQQRANALAQTIGFSADINKTVNEGFYKIDPSYGLCDIHFLQDFSIPISDHEGKTSVLDRQVAIYCPCNCGWANSTGSSGLFP